MGAAPGSLELRPGRGAGSDQGMRTAGGGGGRGMPGHSGLRPWRMQRRPTFTPMAVFVQQSAALLRGGRAPARLWDELWLLYGGPPSPAPSLSDWPLPDAPVPDVVLSGAPRPLLTPLSCAILVAARAAAGSGAPVGAAIRGAATAGAPGAGAAPRNNAAARERGAWIEFAACFDIAEASGSPLADVLARFAAQLEAEDDAEAARQSAFAGPRATVRLLSWLPVLGLGLGVVLGVDPLGILLGDPAGFAALVAGVALTAAGRIWSAKLVRSAAGQSE
ncbi:tight adherence protein B [Arthrobacter sp. B3I9]|nr:tight adherence protein B [Arthrobacter sp. B3I9]